MDVLVNKVWRVSTNFSCYMEVVKVKLEQKFTFLSQNCWKNFSHVYGKHNMVLIRSLFFYPILWHLMTFPTLQHFSLFKHKVLREVKIMIGINQSLSTCDKRFRWLEKLKLHILVNSYIMMQKSRTCNTYQRNVATIMVLVLTFIFSQYHGSSVRKIIVIFSLILIVLVPINVLKHIDLGKKKKETISSSTLSYLGSVHCRATSNIGLVGRPANHPKSRPSTSYPPRPANEPTIQASNNHP